MNPFWWFVWMKRNIGAYTAVLVTVLFFWLLLSIGYEIAYALPLPF